jgi:hypothetical protein
MRRPLAFALLLLACVPILQAHARSRLAPADEYFGRMKMSVLGIRNELHDTALRIRYDPRHADRQLGACRWIEDAIEDWGNKYPDDSWLPGMALDLEYLYARIHTRTSHLQAHHFLAWVERRYGRSHFTRIMSVAAR